MSLKARVHRLRDRRLAAELARAEDMMRTLTRTSGWSYAAVRAEMAAGITFVLDLPGEPCGGFDVEPYIRWLVARHALDAAGEADLWDLARREACRHGQHAGGA